MKSVALLLAFLLAFLPTVFAQGLKGGFTPLKPVEKPETTEKKPLQAILVATPERKPAESFKTDQATIYLLWKGETLTKGEKVRAVWLAEDVGDAAPKDTKIDEYTVEAAGPKSEGTMSLSKPDAGWPVGKYRVELYVGDELKLKVPFTIQN